MDSKVLVNNIKGSFLRDELNDSLLIVPQGCSYNEALIINRIGNEILRVSDGKNSLGEITRILSKRYRQVPMAKVLNDVNSFTNQMLKLNMLKLKEEPKVYKGKQVSTIGDLSVHRCGEGDFKRITNILNNESNIFDFVTSTAKKEDYNPLTIRARIFNFLEEYYILHGNDEDLALIIF